MSVYDCYTPVNHGIIWFNVWFIVFENNCLFVKEIKQE